MPEPLSVEEHLAQVLAAVAPLPPADVALLDALGLVATDDVHADVALPPFDNSAMDGYAVRRADLRGATEAAPVCLPVVGAIGAGDAQVTEIAPGTVAKIMTGAPVPAGADAVVPYEWTDRGAETVRVDREPTERQHVRPAGDDVSVGDLLVAAGTVLTPRHVGLLASVGRASVRVRPRPRVGIVSTGSELREAGQSLEADAIYDGNSHLLAAAAASAGVEVRRVGIVPDRPEEFLAALHAELDAGLDVVVTSGGVSMGDYDVVKAALAPLETMWFGPVAMQPGKPQGFGRVRSERGEALVVTLPGNPVSSYLSFEVFVLPALRRMMGLVPESRPAVRARTTVALRSPAGRRQFLRATHDPAAGTVTPAGGPGSHLVAGLAAADSLLVVPEDVTDLAEGAEVDVLPLAPLPGGR